MEKAHFVKSKDFKMVVMAKDRFDAWRKFFLHVKNHPELLGKIGMLVSVVDEDGEEYCMRTIPALCGLNVIDFETAIINLMQIGFTYTEAKHVLPKLIQTDLQNLKLLKEV